MSVFEVMTPQLVEFKNRAKIYATKCLPEGSEFKGQMRATRRSD